MMVQERPVSAPSSWNDGGYKNLLLTSEKYAMPNNSKQRGFYTPQATYWDKNYIRTKPFVGRQTYSREMSAAETICLL